MSETEEDQNDKPYEASRRKLEDARRKGEIVRSQDAVNFVALAVFMIVLGVIFGSQMVTLVQHFGTLVGQFASDRSSPDGAKLFYAVFGATLPVLTLLFLVPFAVVVLGLVAARQVLFTPDKIKPKLNRLSLVANAKKKFGLSGLFEFGKNVAKFLIFSALMAHFSMNSFPHFEIAILRGDGYGLMNQYIVAMDWLWATLGIFAAFAAIDVLWQYKEHARKNRMSYKEMRDEHKNEEGDESIRQQRRAKAEEIATNRMLLDVPKASVVVTNPTHYAVALQWSGESNTVPKCVAKGTDETARKIREIAMQSGVPLFRDPPTARDLHANLEIGMFIETSHYKAVAAAIGYARRMQQRLTRDD